MHGNRLRTALVAALVAGAVALPAAAGAQGSADAPSLYRQSYAAEGKQDFAQALRLMEQIRAAGQDDYVVSLRMGWLLYLSGRYDDAIAAYRRAVQQEPGSVEPRLGLMLPLMAARRWSEARAAGVEVLDKAPGDFTAQSRIAYIHYQQGQYEKAESWYRKALAGYPSNIEMRAGLAWSLLRQNRFPEARAEFGKVLAVAPDHASAAEGLAQIP
jgi:tetratricopeptide (TPR) repeat protein